MFVMSLTVLTFHGLDTGAAVTVVSVALLHSGPVHLEAAVGGTLVVQVVTGQRRHGGVLVSGGR